MTVLLMPVVEPTGQTVTPATPICFMASRSLSMPETEMSLDIQCHQTYGWAMVGGLVKSSSRVLARRGVAERRRRARAGIAIFLTITERFSL